MAGCTALAGAHNGVNYNKGTQHRVQAHWRKDRPRCSRDFRFKPDTGEFDPQSWPFTVRPCAGRLGKLVRRSEQFSAVALRFAGPLPAAESRHVIPRQIPSTSSCIPRNPPVWAASSTREALSQLRPRQATFTSACGIEVYRGSCALLMMATSHMPSPASRFTTWCSIMCSKRME